MALHQWFDERPSVLPASAALRVSPLSAGSHLAAVRRDRVAAVLPAVAARTTGLGTGSVAGARLRCVEITADLPLGEQGCSVPTAARVPAVTQQKQTKQFPTMQINVVPMYRVGGIGGAPPRGRPD